MLLTISVEARVLALSYIVCKVMCTTLNTLLRVSQGDMSSCPGGGQGSGFSTYTQYYLPAQEGEINESLRFYQKRMSRCQLVFIDLSVRYTSNKEEGARETITRRRVRLPGATGMV